MAAGKSPPPADLAPGSSSGQDGHSKAWSLQILQEHTDHLSFPSQVPRSPGLASTNTLQRRSGVIPFSLLPERD